MPKPPDNSYVVLSKLFHNAYGSIAAMQHLHGSFSNLGYFSGSSR